MVNKNNSDWSHFPELHPVTQAAFDEIAAARYPRDAKKVAHRAGLMVIQSKIPLVEMDAIVAAGNKKVRDLGPYKPGEPVEIPMSETVPVRTALTNEEILARMVPTPSTGADRSQPTGDKVL